MTPILIFRSPVAKYYEEDILEGPQVYDDACLAGLAAHGFNGIWLRGRLRDLAATAVFPELGAQAGLYQERLNTLCGRAMKHGIRVYLYLCEPLNLPADDPFWKNHPGARGIAQEEMMTTGSKDVCGFCTSDPEVKEFLRAAPANLFRACPELGGVFMITRSEHKTHCYSHHHGGPLEGCPRCAARTPSDVIAEVNNLIAEGIHSASPQAQVIAWTWGWDWGWDKPAGETVGEEVFRKLRPDIAPMAAYEMGGWKEIGGKSHWIDEYSLCYAGPADDFLKLYRWARRAGRRVFTKLQIGATHELATVNNVPVITTLLERARWLQSHGVEGILGCWNFGSRLTLNTYAFNRFLGQDLADQNDYNLLAAVARDYLGASDPAPVLAAWKRFAEAFDFYPFHMALLYDGPLNYSVVYPLPRPEDPDKKMCYSHKPLPEPQPADGETKMGPSWLPLKRPYGTRLEETTGQTWQWPAYPGGPAFTIDEVATLLGKLAARFAEGVANYETALGGSPKPEAMRELRNARVIHHLMLSGVNTYEAYSLKKRTPFDEAAWRAIAQREIEHLERLAPLLIGETEIGYHGEAASWFFTEAMVRQKIQSLRELLKENKEKP